MLKANYRPQRSCGQGYVFTRRTPHPQDQGEPRDQGEPPPPDQADPHRDQGEPPPPGRRLQHTVNERSVRILLECNLVLNEGRSCTAEVESELITGVLPKATTDFHSCGGWPSFFLFDYLCKWVVGKKPLLERQLALAATTNPHSSGGPELRLRWWTQTLPRLEKIHEWRLKLSFNN